MTEVKISQGFKMGIRDGTPIGIGYFAISFAFGLMASGYGFPIYESVLISAFCLTSAGQLAALPTMALGGSYLELIMTQALINIRYSLMSISLSQKFDKGIKTADKLYLANTVTDEMFAVAIGKVGKLSKKYLLGLFVLPYIGWVLGTLSGAVAGNVLPKILVDALSVSMYAMFVAILVPRAKASRPILIAVLSSIALSCVFYYTPYLKDIPSGFVIVIIALAVCVPLAALCPIKDDSEDDDGQEASCNTAPSTKSSAEPSTKPSTKSSAKPSTERAQNSKREVTDDARI